MSNPSDNFNRKTPESVEEALERADVLLAYEASGYYYFNAIQDEAVAIVEALVPALREPTVEHLAAVLRHCGVKNPSAAAASIWALAVTPGLAVVVEAEGPKTEDHTFREAP